MTRIKPGLLGEKRECYLCVMQPPHSNINHTAQAETPTRSSFAFSRAVGLRQIVPSLVHLAAAQVLPGLGLDRGSAAAAAFASALRWSAFKLGGWRIGISGGKIAQPFILYEIESREET